MTQYISYDLTAWGKPFEKRKNTLPRPIGREVLVRVIAAGLCHSDLHVQKGYMDLGEEGKLTFAERGAELPMTFGHEIAGMEAKPIQVEANTRPDLQPLHNALLEITGDGWRPLVPLRTAIMTMIAGIIG